MVLVLYKRKLRHRGWETWLRLVSSEDGGPTEPTPIVPVLAGPTGGHLCPQLREHSALRTQS